MTRTLTVWDAVDRYLAERASEVSDSTLYNHRSTLRIFADFCERNDIERVGDIDKWDIAEFKEERDGEVNRVTLYNNMTVLRVFVRWCARYDLVDDGLPEVIVVPDRGNPVRDRMLPADRAEDVAEYL